MEEKKKFHRAWLVFIGCCFLSAGGFALVFDVIGIYLDPVSESTGIDMGPLTLWIGIESVVEFCMMPFAGKLFTSKRVGLFIGIACVLAALGVFGFAFCTKVWQFIVCGCLIGCGMPFLFGLPQTTLIGNWFGKKYQGRMLSIAMACEGVFAAIWAPLFVLIIQATSWQTMYMINGALILVMILPWALFAFKREPADLGLEPYGVSAEDEAEDETEVDSKVGAKAKTAVGSLAFWFVLLAACITSFAMGFSEFLPSLSDELFVPAALMDADGAALFGATMLSIYSIGSLVGTLIIGFLFDKLGMKATLLSYMVIIFVGYAILALVGANNILLLIGSFALGMSNGPMAVGYPLLIRRLYGGKNYPQIYSYVNMCTTLIGGFSTSIVGWVFGFIGTFAATYIAGTCLALLALILVLLATGRIGRTTWDDHEEETAAAA